MTNVQKYFNDFHEAIKLEYEDNKVLRERRDELLVELKECLKNDSRSVSEFHQGSYAMHTGIKALDNGDYDIDVGLVFELDVEANKSPVEVKKWVYNALKDTYPDITMKTPCVTVEFEAEEDDSRNYHVDFAIYAEDINTKDIYLAKGKLYSTGINREWEISEPKELVRKIKERYENVDDRQQFRRVVRYLKRWKDLKFKNQVNRPTGIGLTLAALSHFIPVINRDHFADTKTIKDLEAIKNFVGQMISGFQSVYHDGEYAERLAVTLPTKPYSDVYEGMSNSQMQEFKNKLEDLKENLEKANNEIDIVEACTILQKSFGEDFPVPSEEETSMVKSRTMIPDHSSAWSDCYEH